MNFKTYVAHLSVRVFYIVSNFKLRYQHSLVIMVTTTGYEEIWRWSDNVSVKMLPLVLHSIVVNEFNFKNYLT